ncbi:MAG: protein-L-isoaspartate(D-aspartate) O-methyltransferase [Bacteroidetes bacterium]|nr:MAG: protein-L-isoaspartate(D-aspartate) O-methyltransferase [Bacteroidota bacterium]
MEDTYKHQGQRRKLVDALRRKGIQDEAVLAAIGRLPRHFFLEGAFEQYAYQDKPFPIACEQTISQPYTVAFQTQLLQLEKRQKVLEIGTGSGYQAAILALLGARVFTIERHGPLHQQAQQVLRRLGLKGVRAYHRDGYKGLPELAPFDRILVTAGAPRVPEALVTQLKIGGILVIPVGEAQQRMLRIRRQSESDFITEDHGNFRFVPFLPGVG